MWDTVRVPLNEVTLSLASLGSSCQRASRQRQESHTGGEFECDHHAEDWG